MCFPKEERRMCKFIIKTFIALNDVFADSMRIPHERFTKSIFENLTHVKTYATITTTKRAEFMTAISATKARENIYQLISAVNTNCQPITITNNKGKNAVLIGEEDWKAIEETLYFMLVPGMTESIIRGGNAPLEDCLSEDEVEW